VGAATAVTLDPDMLRRRLREARRD
jgi:hypothetical protein